MRWGETHEAAITGYAALFAERGWRLNATSTRDLVLFPEMDAAADVPEITPGCWSILNVSPDAMMCASSRMIVKRRGAAAPTVLPCTLLPYDARFEMGATLADAACADGGVFDRGAVKLAPGLIIISDSCSSGSVTSSPPARPESPSDKSQSASAVGPQRRAPVSSFCSLLLLRGRSRRR
jgi:hypothetical protein